jgi:outer membrane protein
MKSIHLKNIFRSLLTATFLVMLQLNCLAQSESLSLQQAQEYAAKNAFSVKSTTNDELIAKYATDELLGVGLPQVSASAQYFKYLTVPTSIIPGDGFGAPGQELRLKFGVPHNATVGLSVSQLLFNGTWLVGLEAARAYAELQSDQVGKSQKEVKDKTAQSYFLVLMAKDNLNLLKESKVVIQKIFDDTQALLTNGFVEQLDIDQLQLTINDIDKQINYSEQQIKLTKDLLKFTIGMPLETEIELTDSSDALIQTSDLLSIPFSSESTTDYKLVQGGLHMQQLNLRSKKAALLPTLAAFYNLNVQAQRTQFTIFDTSKPWFPNQMLGVNLSIPILSGGTKAKTIKKTEVEVKKMEDMLAFTKQASQLEYNSARTEYDYALKDFNSSKASLDLAKKILNTTQIKYKEGVASSFDISQRNSQVLQSQGAYVQSMLKLLNAKNRIQKILNQY